MKLIRRAWTVEQQGNVHVVRMQAGSKWSQKLYLMSDVHFDHADCDIKLLKRHLEDAAAENALIFFNGDTLDLMQARNDPRSSFDALRPEFKVIDYVNAVLDEAEKLLGPYAENIVFIGHGNHETSYRKHHSFDTVTALVDRINTKRKAHVQVGGYGGWVRLMVNAWKTETHSVRMKYFHGGGGGGIMSFGTLDTRRQASYIPDADIIWQGHTHDGYVLAAQRERLSDANVVSQKVQWHLRSPSYKDEYRDGSSGWAVERKQPPKPLGCIVGEMTAERKAIGLSFRLEVR